MDIVRAGVQPEGAEANFPSDLGDLVRMAYSDHPTKPPGCPGSLAAWKRAAIAVAVLAVCVQFVRLTLKEKRGDFDVHWESGRRLLAGEPLYDQQGGQDDLGHNYPYPPFWALAHTPFSYLPLHAAQLLLYPLIIVAAFVLVGVLNRLTRRQDALDDDRIFLVVAGSIFLTSRFLVRDMPECGVNLALVALSWLAVERWVRRRDWAGGWLLGLAMSLKCTPALFWVWFLWKRQWKMAGTTALAAGVFTLSPMLIMGPAAYVQTMTEWTRNAWRGIGEDHPAYGVLGDEPLQNVSLRPALARYLTELPPGHRSRIEHPLYVDVLTLSPVASGWIIKGVLLALLLGMAVCFRRRIIRRDDPQWLWEAAAVSVLILLFSPITWGQHCVGVLPGFYLLMRMAVSGRRLPAWMVGLLAVYVLGTLVFNRELIGKDLTYLLDSYRLPTFLLLALLAVMVGAGRLAWQERPLPERAKSPQPANCPTPYKNRELATSHYEA